MCQCLGPKKHGEILEIDRSLRLDGAKDREVQAQQIAYLTRSL